MAHAASTQRTSNNQHERTDMKMRQLFREVWLELHPDKNDEEAFKHADRMVPGSADKEIPEDQVELHRQYYLALGRKIDARSAEENENIFKKFLSNN